MSKMTLQVHNICLSQLGGQEASRSLSWYLCLNVDGVVLNNKYVPLFIGASKYKGEYSHEWG